jgi:hypothetical protein
LYLIDLIGFPDFSKHPISHAHDQLKHNHVYDIF